MNDFATELWSRTWQQLQRATVHKRHPFGVGTLITNHLYQFGENQQELAPRSRTVVLRRVDLAARELLAYTDVRSFKAKDILAGRNFVSWCFWNPKSNVQFTCVGVAKIITGPAARQRYMELPKHSRKAYATRSAPGSNQPTAGDGLPDDWENRECEETDYAAENFAFLTTTVLQAEILQLSREGHRRIRGQLLENGSWDLTNITP